MKSYKLYTMAISLIGSEMFVIQCHHEYHYLQYDEYLLKVIWKISDLRSIYENSHSRVLDEMMKDEVIF